MTVDENKKMKVLFLTVSNQQNHPLGKYTDLHRTFDFKPWEKGFCAIPINVYMFDYYASFVLDGPSIMENNIRNLVQKQNIQLLIVPSLYYEIAPTFLNDLRSIGCKSLVVFFDDSIRFEEMNRFYLNSFDYYLTHESAESLNLYKSHGVEATFFPNFPSILFYKGILQGGFKNVSRARDDIVFVGANIADREMFVSYLKNNGVDVAVFGKGWSTGMLSTVDMIRMFNSSKISLSFIKTVDGSGRHQLKGRIFEIVMAGGFVLSEYSEELADYFEIGREIDVFCSPEELLKKVRYYLKNPDLREEMSLRAKNRAINEYSFEFRWTQYISDIESGKLKSEYPNTGYNIPHKTVKAFLRWNFIFVYGRFMLGQFALTRQQYKFCRRELESSGSRLQLFPEFIRWAGHNFLKAVAYRLFRRNLQNIRFLI